MRMRLFLLPLMFVSFAAVAQEGKSYPDGHDGEVYFPLGDISFADELVSFDIGEPNAANDDDSIPEEALGPPDYTGDDKYVTLGCGGVVVFRFVDNVLAEIDGPDLYVFEIGPAVEATLLSISGDGENWRDVGRIAGATAAVDIAEFVQPNETFSYVKLTDARQRCSGRWPGADIDAVGAIGAGRRVVLDSAVLFDFDKSELKPDAEAALLALAEEIAQYETVRVVIEGHTDSVGSDAYNMTLSAARAQSVRTFLVERGGAPEASIESVGYGETRPAAANDTDENRAKNRRVEVLIIVG